MTDSSLEETALNIFKIKELGVSIDTSDIEACHRVGPRSRKKVIVKIPRQKDADRVRRVKQTLTGMRLKSLEVDNPIFMNDSLCSYYKRL